MGEGPFGNVSVLVTCDMSDKEGERDASSQVLFSFSFFSSGGEYSLWDNVTHIHDLSLPVWFLLGNILMSIPDIHSTNALYTSEPNHIDNLPSQHRTRGRSNRLKNGNKKERKGHECS